MFLIARKIMEDKDQLTNIKKRLSVLEFFITLTLSLFLTFIYALTQIFKISWYPIPLTEVGAQFFAISFLSINFVFFIENTIEKVGLNLSSLLNQWKSESSLNRILIIFGLPSSIIGIIQVIKWFIELLK
jgi:hypothetical protein